MTNDQAPIQHSEAPPSAPATAPAAIAPAEKMITSSEVNSIVQGRVKSATDKGYSSGYDAARSELKNQYSQEAQQAPNTPSQALVSPHSGLSEEQVRSHARDEYSKQKAEDERNYHAAQSQRQQQEIDNGVAAVDKILKEKVAEAKERFPDIDEKLGGAGNFKTDPLIRVYASQSDDPAGMLHHLATHPEVYLNIVAAGNIGNYDMQQTIVNGINATMKKNKDAADIRMPNAPLSQPESSLGSNSPNEKLTMSDLSKMFPG